MVSPSNISLYGSCRFQELHPTPQEIVKPALCNLPSGPLPNLQLLQTALATEKTGSTCKLNGLPYLIIFIVLHVKIRFIRVAILHSCRKNTHYRAGGLSKVSKQEVSKTLLRAERMFLCAAILCPLVAMSFTSENASRASRFPIAAVSVIFPLAFASIVLFLLPSCSVTKFYLFLLLSCFALQ